MKSSLKDKKLHPNLLMGEQGVESSRARIPQGQIQMDFDPTPVSWLQNETQTMKSIAKEFSEHQEINGELKVKMGRLSQKISNLEERLEALSLEMRGNYSKLLARVSEKMNTDSRIESFVEKHNQILQSFDRRMSQMTKLVEDYQNRVMISNAALEDARREIARLKKV